MIEEIKIPSESVALIIFGVTGDLTKRKLMPALYELCQSGRILFPLHIVGFARRDWSDDYFKKTMLESIENFEGKLTFDHGVINHLLTNMHFISSNFDNIEGYYRLSEYLGEKKITNILYYLATPPDSYVEIIRNIGRGGLQKQQNGWSRIVIEKPYGRDIQSAEELENEVHNVFKEHQIYRIDHYLGKETVQNILVLRFANGIFEPLWNRSYVDHVQITVAETVGVGSRAGYYEKAGVIRDVFQNHLLQLLSLTAMEAPAVFNANFVRDEKVKILKAIRPLKKTDVLENTYRAQYVSGSVDGKRVISYKDEPGVANNSTIETFMAARLFLDNWRWSGIPFYIRSGKRLNCRATEIAIQFKQVPLSLFNWHNMAGDAPNVLIINLQPDEGIILTFGAKIPGPINQIEPAKMEFRYKDAFGISSPNAYERLLLDAMMGDATLFTRSDEILAQWDITSHILDAWNASSIRHLPVYEAGTWGPPGADDFIGKDNRHWHNPCYRICNSNNT